MIEDAILLIQIAGFGTAKCGVNRKLNIVIGGAVQRQDKVSTKKIKASQRVRLKKLSHKKMKYYRKLMIAAGLIKDPDQHKQKETTKVKRTRARKDLSLYPSHPRGYARWCVENSLDTLTY